jgi:hypothetical protein
MVRAEDRPMRRRLALTLILLAAWLVPAGEALAQGMYTMPNESASALSEADRPQRPGAAVGTAVLNLVYVPVRLAVTAVGLTASSLTGWLTAGNQNAADDTWNVFRGQAFLTPSILEGKERLRVGPWEVGGR